MKMKTIASLLICALTLLTVTPSKAVAQREQNPGGVQAKPRPHLKSLFAEETANVKVGTLSAADIKRLEKERLDPQSTARPNSGFSKREKILAVVIVVAITAVAIVLVHNGVDPKPRCEDDPSAPGCIQ